MKFYISELFGLVSPSVACEDTILVARDRKTSSIGDLNASYTNFVALSSILVFRNLK